MYNCKHGCLFEYVTEVLNFYTFVSDSWSFSTTVAPKYKVHRIILRALDVLNFYHDIDFSKRYDLAFCPLICHCISFHFLISLTAGSQCRHICRRLELSQIMKRKHPYLCYLRYQSHDHFQMNQALIFVFVHWYLLYYIKFYLLMVKTIFSSFAALIRKILFSPLEEKTYIFAPPCNALISKSKQTSKDRCHVENKS